MTGLSPARGRERVESCQDRGHALSGTIDEPLLARRRPVVRAARRRAAQAVQRLPRVGVLYLALALARGEGPTSGLGKAACAHSAMCDGRNVVFEWRYAEGRPDRLAGPRRRAGGGQGRRDRRRRTRAAGGGARATTHGMPDRHRLGKRPGRRRLGDDAGAPRRQRHRADGDVSRARARSGSRSLKEVAAGLIARVAVIVRAARAAPHGQPICRRKRPRRRSASACSSRCCRCATRPISSDVVAASRVKARARGGPHGRNARSCSATGRRIAEQARLARDTGDRASSRSSAPTSVVLAYGADLNDLLRRAADARRPDPEGRARRRCADRAADEDRADRQSSRSHGGSESLCLSRSCCSADRVIE